MRTRLVNFVFLGAFLIIVMVLLSTEVIHGRRFRELSNKNCIRLVSQLGTRGMILDREGNVIADSYISYDVMLLPQPDDNVDEVLSGVAKVLGVRQQELRERFRKEFIAPSLPVTIAGNIPVKKAVALEEKKMDLPGVIIQPHPLRRYPYGKLACHLLGYLGEIDRWRLTKLEDYGYKTRDIVGFGGVEERYDYYLRQEEGGFSTQVDHRGRFVRTLGYRPPQNGKDIQLTLDLRVQKLAEEALGRQVGSVVVMEPASGEIIAMANNPDFNPAAFVDRKSDAELKWLFNDPKSPLINRATSSTYPPGSVFKVVVASAALETGRININTTTDCTGSFYVGRQRFACWNTHGTQNVVGAIMHSCNVFFYRTGLLVGPQAIYEYALRFGLSKPTGVDLPYEASGFVPSPLWKRVYRFSAWFNGDTANFAIGQGDLLVSPLQIARVMAVFANNGFLVTPYVLKGVGGKDISLYQRKFSKVSVKEGTINIVRQGMRKVASEGGTASNLSGLGVEVAGKTGTSQVGRGLPHGWFAGFFPYKNPRFVICVFLEHGGAGYYASTTAKRIIEGMIKEGII
ncbi:MAG: penicillin-binding protein 2 [Candidatus Omnitrophota bacterium]